MSPSFAVHAPRICFQWSRRGAVLLAMLGGLSACGQTGSGSAANGGSSAQGGSAQGGNISQGGSSAGGAPSAGASGSLNGGSGGTFSSAGTSGLGGSSGSAGSSSHPTPGVGSGQALSSTLIGQNYWTEPDTEALWPVVKASGVKLIRFGGAGADDERPSNERYAAVVNAIRAIGAEPYLQISRYFDAARAKAIVDYINNAQHLHVSLWSINNEPDIGANEPLMSVTDSANLVKSLASAMKEADATIQIFAPEVAYYNEQYLGPMLGGASDITGKDANGRYYIDGVSFHSYPFGANYTRDQATGAAAGMKASVAKLMTALASANQKNGRTGAAALRWALTEFNISYQNPADNSVTSFGVHSFLNGQYFAELYGIGMANGAVTFAPWSIHESSGNRSPSDLGYLDGPVGSPTPRSSYYHLQMIAQNFAGNHAPTTSSQPLLRAVAAGNGTQVSVLLLNESLDQSYAFGVRLDGGKLTTPAAVTVTVDAALPAEFSGNLAAQSSTLLLFDAAGKLIKRIDYALADAQKAGPPRQVTP